MTVTVCHMLECHDMSVMPLDAFSNINDDILQKASDPHEWCLFSIEVRNTYGLPFEVTFDSTRQGKVELFTLQEAHQTRCTRCYSTLGRSTWLDMPASQIVNFRHTLGLTGVPFKQNHPPD